MTRTVVGVDIGSAGVRAAEFAIGRRRISLRKYAAVDLPDGTLRAGTVADPDALTEAMRELWSRGKFSTKSVVLGIANSGVLVRQMDLEWMPAGDFRKGLRYQVADALPVPVDEANLDYYMLDEVDLPAEGGEAGRKVARVMLVAAGREMVDAFVRAVQAAGLRPVKVDLLPFALVRAVTPIVDADTPPEAIVDVGAESVVVVVHQGGRPHFVRTLSGHGGEAITRGLMDRFDWDREDAERTKIVLGLPGHEQIERVGPGEFGEDQQLPDLADHPGHQAISEHVESLVNELRTTLTYVRGAAGNAPALVRVVLTGRGAQLGGLAETLQEQLGVPVEHASLDGRVRTGGRAGRSVEDGASLVVPAGLCLGRAR
jgi:type IV pilus assembly protein PilM